MPELRKDPIIGRWVIIATERAKRPSASVDKSQKKKGGFCPFCTGNEAHTPKEVLSYRLGDTKKDTPGWWIRVVPNKFPALQVEGQPKRMGVGRYDKMNGVGAHEVIIETPKHDLAIADMPEKQVQEIIWAYRDRSIELRKDKRFRYILIFKNHGREAGATLEHPHSQLIALPIIPKRVQEEVAGSAKYFDYKERCVFCDIINQELTDNVRIVAENDTFLSFLPFASRFPFETWIIPKEHECFFNDLQKNDVIDLASILKKTLRKIKYTLNDPPYNYLIHTTPFEIGPAPYYHWHIEIIPKLTNVAGFEWGTGFYINPTPPEIAAQYLAEVENESQGAEVISMKAGEKR